MAINDPHIIGVRKVCVKCGQSFRCPVYQLNRVTCRACE